jgi:hypothetical protein
MPFIIRISLVTLFLRLPLLPRWEKGEPEGFLLRKRPSPFVGLETNRKDVHNDNEPPSDVTNVRVSHPSPKMGLGQTAPMFEKRCAAS